MDHDRGLARLTAVAAQRERASGTGAVSWKTARRSIAATGVLVLDWPRALRLEVQDPLGGMVAFLILREGEFWSYTEEQGMAVTGDLDDKRAREVLPLPLTTRDYLRVLLAKPPLDEVEAEYGKRPNTLTFENEERSDFLEWDTVSDQPRLWRMLRKDKTGSYIEAVYSDYVVKAGIPYPSKVRITLVEGGREKLRLSWQWNDLETYIPKISDVFEIPPAWAKNVRTRRNF